MMMVNIWITEKMNTAEKTTVKVRALLMGNVRMMGKGSLVLRTVKAAKMFQVKVAAQTHNPRNVADQIAPEIQDVQDFKDVLEQIVLILKVDAVIKFQTIVQEVLTRRYLTLNVV